MRRIIRSVTIKCAGRERHHCKSCGVTSISSSCFGLSEVPSNEMALSPTFSGYGPTNTAFPDSTATFNVFPFKVKVSTLMCAPLGLSSLIVHLGFTVLNADEILLDQLERKFLVEIAFVINGNFEFVHKVLCSFIR